MLKFYTLIFLFITHCITAQISPAAVWQTDAYTIYRDSVVQGNKFVAKALSATEIVCNYKSPASRLQSTKLSFKFSINGKDNEMAPGVDHHFNVVNGVGETPVINNRPTIPSLVALLHAS